MIVAQLQGKVAVVTGAASGLGRATAEELSRRGAAVMLADLNADGAEAAAAKIREDGALAAAVRVDIADEGSVEAMIEATVAELGGLDIVHANAALTSPDVIAADRGIAEIDAALFARVLQVNVIGTALTAKYGAEQLARGGGGVVVFTTSQDSRLGDVVRTMYSASKAAIESLMRDVATQYGLAGVRAVSVSPGMILTEGARSVSADARENLKRHNLLPRFGMPEDIANTVAFLASDDAAYITGISVAVDGGRLQHQPNLVDDRATAQG
jgi:NAD(P)-dependent dehydrogenase (short-subunit alcohol dehydrogenase family)